MRKGNSMKTGKNYYSSLFFLDSDITGITQKKENGEKVRKQTDYYFPPSFAAGKVDQKR